MLSNGSEESTGVWGGLFIPKLKVMETPEDYHATLRNATGLRQALVRTAVRQAAKD